jgi:hypothetical protein
LSGLWGRWNFFGVDGWSFPYIYNTESDFDLLLFISEEYFLRLLLTFFFFLLSLPPASPSLSPWFCSKLQSSQNKEKCKQESN